MLSLSPIADPLVPSPVSACGAAPLPAAPHPHSFPVTSITEQSVRHVAIDPCRFADRLGASRIAVQKRFEEVQLLSRDPIHAQKHEAWSRQCGPKKSRMSSPK